MEKKSVLVLGYEIRITEEGTFLAEQGSKFYEEQIKETSKIDKIEELRRKSEELLLELQLEIHYAMEEILSDDEEEEN